MEVLKLKNAITKIQSQCIGSTEGQRWQKKMPVDRIWAFQVMLVIKNLPASSGDTWDKGSIPGSGRYPGGEHGNPRTIKTPQLKNTEKLDIQAIK